MSSRSRVLTSPPAPALLRVIFLLVGGLVLVPSFARLARASPRLNVEVDPCVGVSAIDIRRDVAIELDALLVEAREGQSVDTTRVSINCDGRYMRIQVEDPLSGKTLSRRIDPSRETPRGRPRMLALAVVELVAASWLELKSKQGPGAEAVDATASLDARRSAAASVGRLDMSALDEAHWRLTVSGAFRTFSDSLAGAFGGGIDVQRNFPHGLGLVTGGMVEGASTRVSLGQVGSLLASVGLMGVVRSDFRRWGMQGGVGLRLGLVTMSGHPDGIESNSTGTTLTRLWGGPLLAARVHAELGHSLLIVGGVETGLVIRPVEGLVAGLAEINLKGYWVGATIGLGWQN